MYTTPVLSASQIKDYEAGLFAGDEKAEWRAMCAAGKAVALAAESDFRELRPFPAKPRLLVLVGKGHNGGDSLLAAADVLARHAGATCEVMLFFPENTMRPLTLRAWRELTSLAPGRVSLAAKPSGAYTLSLDGVFGFQYRTPSAPALLQKLVLAKAAAVEMRVAVDLPSAFLEDGGFSADFTYATGAVKEALLTEPGLARAGRIRFLDIGLFEPSAVDIPPSGRRVLTSRALDSLRGWRASRSDKRDNGHVGIVGGSRRFPGALLMCVKAALKGGSGLVTAFAPESLVASFAAQVPEAMWVAWPETETGGLALEGLHLVREHGTRVTAWVVGPGCGRDRETQVMLGDLVALLDKPMVLDADALQPEFVARVKGPLILTPHAGELQRLEAGGFEIDGRPERVLVKKGSPTWVRAQGVDYLVPFGGPVLARGGSGDMLSGLAGARAAQRGVSMVEAACEAVVWHSMAADRLARERGQVAVTTTELLEWLSPVLREPEYDLADSRRRAGAVDP